MNASIYYIDMIIAGVILAVLVAAPTFIVYKIAERFPPARPIPYFPAGVKGWLMLFVATIMLSIIVTVFNLFTYAVELKDNNAFNIFLFSPHLVVLGLYFYMLWLIAVKRTASVVQQTIVILWVVGPISLILLAGFFDAPFDVQSILRTSFYALAWTLYLLFSKRVACTYGTKAVDSFIKIAVEMAQGQKAAQARKDSKKQ